MELPFSHRAHQDGTAAGCTPAACGDGGSSAGTERNGSIRNGQVHRLRRSREADMLGTERQLRTPEQGLAATETLRA